MTNPTFTPRRPGSLTLRAGEHIPYNCFVWLRGSEVLDIHYGAMREPPAGADTLMVSESEYEALKAGATRIVRAKS